MERATIAEFISAFGSKHSEAEYADLEARLAGKSGELVLAHYRVEVACGHSTAEGTRYKLVTHCQVGMLAGEKLDIHLDGRLSRCVLPALRHSFETTRVHGIWEHRRELTIQDGGLDVDTLLSNDLCKFVVGTTEVQAWLKERGRPYAKDKAVFDEFCTRLKF